MQLFTGEVIAELNIPIYKLNIKYPCG